MERLISGLRKKLAQSVEKNVARCILFSGGLDTSILAGLNPGSFAVNVSLESSGEDVSYAGLLADHFNMQLCRKNVMVKEAIGAIPKVIKILKSFDPAIPNDLVVYFGLREAKEKGYREIMTGDGADEIFAGYSYMREIKDLEKYIKKLNKNMCFNSNKMGEYFGLAIKQPYLDKEVVDFALNIPVELKIRKEQGAVWGKWVLRKAFEKSVPSEFIWQSKRPLECGSGMSRLRDIIESKISDKEFNEKKKLYPVKFITKDHLYYYEIYRKELGDVPGPEEGQKSCVGCGAGIDVDSFHCKVCGNLQER